MKRFIKIIYNFATYRSIPEQKGCPKYFLKWGRGHQVRPLNGFGCYHFQFFLSTVSLQRYYMHWIYNLNWLEITTTGKFARTSSAVHNKNPLNNILAVLWWNLALTGESVSDSSSLKLQVMNEVPLSSNFLKRRSRPLLLRSIIIYATSECSIYPNSNRFKLETCKWERNLDKTKGKHTAVVPYLVATKYILYEWGTVFTPSLSHHPPRRVQGYGILKAGGGWAGYAARRVKNDHINLYSGYILMLLLSHFDRGNKWSTDTC